MCATRRAPSRTVTTASSGLARSRHSTFLKRRRRSGTPAAARQLAKILREFGWRPIKARGLECKPLKACVLPECASLAEGIEILNLEVFPLLDRCRRPVEAERETAPPAVRLWSLERESEKGFLIMVLVPLQWPIPSRRLFFPCAS